MKRYDAWIRKALVFFFGMIHKTPSEEVLESLVQFVKFCTIGVTNTAVSYGINAAVLLILAPYHLSWDYVAGNVTAFLLSVLWSFYWNNKYVFKKGENQERSLWKSLFRTYMAYGVTGIVLNNLLSFLWIDKLGISKFLAPLMNLVISIPLNFLINKYWAFGEKRSGDSKDSPEERRG